MRVEREHGRVGHWRMRFYHAMYQLFIFAMLLALLTNNVGVLWISMELATLATVLLVSLYRTPNAIEAAWKYFILCGVGIAQALFGTVLLYFAAERVLGVGGEALLWTNLSQVSGQLEPTVLRLAFVFLMVGYGTKVGLVPLHNWLPDAHSEGPTPISAVLSGLLLNVALYALVRCKVLVDGSTGTHMAGNMLIGFGLLSILVAAFSLLRQKDIKRMFAYSSIENMGIATFAFGIGGPIATFGALLHMLVHSLVKSSIFFTVGHASQMHGTQEMDRIRGLIKGNPVVGWAFIFGAMALVGMPPFGLFASEFLILTATIKEAPFLDPAPPPGAGGLLCRHFPEGPADGRRGRPPLADAAQGGPRAGHPAHGPGAGARPLPAALPVRLVPYGSGVTEMSTLRERMTTQLGDGRLLRRRRSSRPISRCSACRGSSSTRRRGR